MSTPHPQKSLNSGLIIDEIGLYFNYINLPPAARGPHGMGDLLGPSGLLKASLNEPDR